MAAAIPILILVVALTCFLPITLSVFAYAFVEARHRHAWTRLAPPPVRVGQGPYRAADIAPARLLRAPLLVRAAALGCFYWSWFCLLSWAFVGIASSDRPVLGPFVVVGLVVAAGVGRAGFQLLRRDRRAVAFGRRVALLSAVHAALLVVLGFALGGADGSAPAAVVGVVSLAQAAVLVLALRKHAPLFAPPREGDVEGRPLPGWLAHMLARRARNRSRKAAVLG